VNVSKSANEIIELINRFKHETDRAVHSMQEGARVVQNGVASANRAGASLNTIMGAVERVSQLMAQTDKATRSQVEATSEVRDTLEDLTKLSLSARDAAHRTSEEAAGMEKSVENLRRVLTHFKLGKRQSSGTVNTLLRKARDTGRRA
jgi:methyl-accepting chemotaxis protein